jgi:N-dimethylarginine dimethylaminohydrolase
MFTIRPTHFSVVPSKQNPYLNADVDWELAQRQHAALMKALGDPPTFESEINARDSVFVANSGLSLPRLPPTFVLSKMKYAQRRLETPLVASILKKIKLVEFPGPDPFEGEGECCWFHGGRLLVVGYGQRSTRRSVQVLDDLLRRVYSAEGVTPPIVLGVKLISPFFYHLDLAMLPVSDTEALFNPAAFHDLDALRDHIQLIPFKTDDPFVLNSVFFGKKLITHKLDAKTRRQLQKYGKVVEVDVSEFEKAGGSVRCMVCHLFRS